MINYENKHVIVRGDRSGVFFGVMESIKGREVTLKNARKLYFWAGACAVEQLAVDGVANPSECKFTVFVDDILILDAIQILPCSEKSCHSLTGVIPWSK